MFNCCLLITKCWVFIIVLMLLVGRKGMLPVKMATKIMSIHLGTQVEELGIG